VDRSHYIGLFNQSPRRPQWQTRIQAAPIEFGASRTIEQNGGGLSQSI
jgi:hypothetical protein